MDKLLLKRWSVLGIAGVALLALGVLLSLGISAKVGAHGGDTTLGHACAESTALFLNIVITPGLVPAGDFDCTALGPGWFNYDTGDISGVAVAAGSGLTGGAGSGVATLGTDSAVLQQRVAGTCPVGQAIRVVDSAGAVTCQVAGGPAIGIYSFLCGGCYLVGISLPGADLSNGWLLNADLTGADLTGANLTDVHLSLAVLFKADLTGANLTNANLGGNCCTDMRNVNLTNANLTGADLSIADLFTANLTNAKLTNATLTSAHLRDADLTGANLTDAIVNRAADLTNANLTNANLTGADLLSGTPAILTGVIWFNTICPDGTNSNDNGNTCVGHL